MLNLSFEWALGGPSFSPLSRLKLLPFHHCQRIPFLTRKSPEGKKEVPSPLRPSRRWQESFPPPVFEKALFFSRVPPSPINRSSFWAATGLFFPLSHLGVPCSRRSEFAIPIVRLFFFFRRAGTPSLDTTALYPAEPALFLFFTTGLRTGLLTSFPPGFPLGVIFRPGRRRGFGRRC